MPISVGKVNFNKILCYLAIAKKIDSFLPNMICNVKF